MLPNRSPVSISHRIIYKSIGDQVDKFEIEIVNYFDTEECVGEVYYSSFQWAKIFHLRNGIHFVDEKFECKKNCLTA